MALLQARSDIEVLTFPNGVGKADFNALLREHAPVHAVALGPTRFGEAEMVSAGDIRVVTRIGLGFDAVALPAVNRTEHGRVGKECVSKGRYRWSPDTLKK